MSNFEKFKEELPSKEKFYSSLTDKKISGKDYDYVFTVWNKSEMKTMKDSQDLYIQFHVLLLSELLLLYG